jgi:hypothetical protein
VCEPSSDTQQEVQMASGYWQEREEEEEEEEEERRRKREKEIMSCRDPDCGSSA